ncbi:cilia- and flagella-associated protein 77-like [Sceloporus undulatus]|uniref:cilia- and flagella-associated protein 77-like n=1 Tax=Sceloporus undulatus TaxID=8520 RepID=UPI001C4ABA65|nr:cilia- and flagella-associated protein 77-like [Sceloporus undulatus]
MADSFVKRYLERRRRRASVSDICGPPLLPLTCEDIKRGTENDRLGRLRDSMFQNHLILKPELGRTQRRCAKIPGSDFVYGLSLRGTDGGVPEAIGHWNVMPPRVYKKKEMPKDYIAMNRKGLKIGLFTAREHSLYHQYHVVRRKEMDSNRFIKDPPRLPDAMTYGRPARPSTPIVDVLQHKFGDLWIEEHRKFTEVEKEKKRKQKLQGKTYETRTVMLRKHQIPVKLDSLWHMPRFEKNAIPNLVTFPTLKDKVKALKAQQSEVPVRRGQLPHGIYTLAS